MEKKTLIPLFFIFVVVLLLYYPVFSVYFTGDDFFHFKVSQTDGSFLEFIKLFGFYAFGQRGIAFYRPIFREALYNIFYSLFYLNHIPFRVFALFIHFINITLVYVLMQKLFNKKTLSFFTAFFFGITAANVGILYYLAGGIQAQGATMFLLATLLLFLSNKKYLSFLTYILALASHELAVVALPLLAGLTLIHKESFKKLWPFALVFVLYLYLNFFVIGFSESEAQYQLVFNVKKTLNTLSWYSAWALGLPEMTVDFVKSGLSLDPRLMRYWGDYFRVIFPAFFASILILASFVVYLASRKSQIFKDKKFWLLAFWFPASLLPVLFLPLHKKTYYLAAGLPAFWGLIGYLIYRFKPKILVLLSVVLVILSITSIRLGDKTYWAAKRGRIAKKLITQIKSEYPKLPKGAVVYIKNDPNYPFIAEDWGSTSKQTSYILSGSDALQLLYKDPTLKVFYEDLGGIPEDFSGNIFSLVAILSD